MNCNTASVDVCDGSLGCSCTVCDGGSFGGSALSLGVEFCDVGVVNLSKDCKKLASPKLSKVKKPPF